MNKEYVLAADNEYVPLVNIKELHIFNGADETTGDDFTDDGYFHLWCVVYDKPSTEFCAEVQTRWGDIHILKEYVKFYCPGARCVKLGTISVKPNSKLDYDQYWEYLWKGAFQKAEDIAKKIEICRNEFSKKVLYF